MISHMFLQFPAPCCTALTVPYSNRGHEGACCRGKQNQAAMHGSLLTATQGTAAHAAARCVVVCCLMNYVDIGACMAYVLGFVCIVLTCHAIAEGE